MSHTLPERARQLLAEPLLVVLTTLNPDGSPHSTPVWADWDGRCIVMSTLTKRAKYRNLTRDPRASVVLLDPELAVRYFCVNGSVEIEPDDDRAVLHRLSQKYLGTPYPLAEGPDQVRVTLRLAPDHVIGQYEAAR